MEQVWYEYKNPSAYNNEVKIVIKKYTNTKFKKWKTWICNTIIIVLQFYDIKYYKRI